MRTYTCKKTVSAQPMSAKEALDLHYKIGDHSRIYYTTTNKYIAHIMCFILQTFSNKRTEYWVSRGY